MTKEQIIETVNASAAILVETTYGNFLLQEVGKDIFLAKAEAEKRLQELRGEV